MFDDREVCGTCKYNFYDENVDDFNCDNPESDMYMAWIGCNDSCEEWDEKE